MKTVYLGIGSNLGDPRFQLRRAFDALSEWSEVDNLRASRFYWSRPHGVDAPMPDFLNAVAELKTRLSPMDFLTGLQAMESRAGRTRKTGAITARTLDVDILWWEDVVLKMPELLIPHPRAIERDFVLRPWIELAPERILLDGRTLEACLRALPEETLSVLKVDEASPYPA